MSTLTLFDARNDATVRRAMRDAARTSSGVVFGNHLAAVPYVDGWTITKRMWSHSAAWQRLAYGLTFDDAVRVVTHYARNKED